MTKKELSSLVSYPKSFKDITTFGDVIYSDDFGSGGPLGSNLPTGWTTADVDSQGNGFVWKWTNVGATGPTTAGYQHVLASTTASNGWMILDSDLYGTGSYDAMLYSPTYNLSAQPSVALVFQELYKRWGTETGNPYGGNPTYVGYSIDGGTTWTNIELHVGYAVKQETSNPGNVMINLTAVVANQASVKLRFEMKGDWDYWWQIDDMKLIVAPDDNMELTGTNVASQGLYSTGYGFTGYYSQIPMDEIPPIAFVGDLWNNGNLAQTNVVYHVTVSDSLNAAVWNGASVALASVPFNEYDTVLVDTPYFMAPPQPKLYHTSKNVSQTQTDQITANNVAKGDTFRITNNIWARDYFYTTMIGPLLYTGGTDGDLLGNYYHTANVDTVVALQVYFSRLAKANTTMIGYLFSVDESTGTKTQKIASLEYTVLPTDTNKWVTLNLVAFNPGDDILATNTDYIAGVEFYYSPDTLLIGSDDITTHDFNHSLSVLRLGGTWYRIDLCPMIRVQTRLHHVDVNVPIVDKTTVKVYPSPTSGKINVDCSADSNIYVYDLLGNIVLKLEKSDTHTILDMTGFAPGTYAVKVISKDNVHTQKVNLIK